MLTALLRPEHAAPVRSLCLPGYLLGGRAPQPVRLDTHLPLLDKYAFFAEAVELDAERIIHGKP